MKLQLTHEICHQMEPHLAPEQSKILEKTLLQVFSAINLFSCKKYMFGRFV